MAYLSGGIGLALRPLNHREAAPQLAEPPQVMTMYITPRKKKAAPESPSVSPPVPAPEPMPVANTPPPTPQPIPPPAIAQESPQPKPKTAPVVSAKKSTIALKTPRHAQSTATDRRPETPAGADHDRPPERKPAPSKPAEPSGTVAASQLDELPRLLNSPSVSFPPSIRRRGITEGRAVLEVEIDTRGRVTVRRILEISDSALESTARSFAAAARFSTPRRDGQPVRTLFRWPLTLRP